MIQRYSCIPRAITRRKFGAAIGAALLGTTAQKIARASDPAVTVVIVPDPQYLAESTVTCSGTAIYSNMIDWAITNKALVVNGTPLNIKGFVTVGDCQNDSLPSSYTDGASRMNTAFDLAYAANMFVVHCPGNHDYYLGGTTGDRSNIGAAWKSGVNGYWSPANLAAKYGNGAGIDLGSGDSAVFGGVYTDPTYAQSSANNYVKVKLGSRKMLIVALEFFPRASVLTWAAGLHDANPDHEMWITTHSYLTSANNLVTRGTGNNATNQYGPDAYAICGAYPASTSGTEQWTAIQTLARNSLVTCGHWVDNAPLNAGNWIKKWSTPNNSGRPVHQIFANAQQADYGAGACTGDIAHLMLLRIWPTTCEAFMVSTTGGTWGGMDGTTGQSSPIQLFSVQFDPVPSGAGTGIWALPGPITHR